MQTNYFLLAGLAFYLLTSINSCSDTGQEVVNFKVVPFEIKDVRLLEGSFLHATENITNKAPGKFIDVSYKIPWELLNKKEKVEVKFVPHEGHRAGPVFTVRIIRDPSH